MILRTKNIFLNKGASIHRNVSTFEKVKMYYAARGSSNKELIDGLKSMMELQFVK